MISAFGVIHDYGDIEKSWNFDKSKDKKKSKDGKKDAPPWLKAKVKDESKGDKDPIGKAGPGMAFKVGQVAGRTARVGANAVGAGAGKFNSLSKPAKVGLGAGGAFGAYKLGQNNQNNKFGAGRKPF